MSKPSICRLVGFTEPNLNVSAETPATRRPRCWIFSMTLPAGICAGAGIDAGGRTLAVGSHCGAGTVVVAAPGEVVVVPKGWAPVGSGLPVAEAQPAAAMTATTTAIDRTRFI